MNRRHAVKNLAIASGGWISLPFWMVACGTREKSLPDTLAAIVDAIIPAGTASPGALSLGVDKFLHKLIDDCYDAPAQAEVKEQLAALDASAKTKYGSSFATCPLPQRQQLVTAGLSSPNKKEKAFFESMKSETIRGFNTSQPVMEGYLNYKVAPGHYYGCVSVKG